MPWPCATAKSKSDGHFMKFKRLMLGLGLVLMLTGSVAHAQHSVEKYQKAADRGDANAQFHLGLYYANGQGVEKNLTEAAKWYRKAAEQGYAKAQCNLGLCYANGQGDSVIGRETRPAPLESLPENASELLTAFPRTDGGKS